MLKIKKKPFFLSLFIFLIAFLIALPLFFSYFSGYFLKSYSKKIFSGEISYESLKFENGKIIAKNVIGSSDLFDIKIEEVFFKIKLNLPAFDVSSDILLIRPHVIVTNKKQIDLSDQNFWKGKKKLIKSKINVKDGKIELYEKNALVTKIHFNLEQKDFADTFFLNMGFDEKMEKRVGLQIKKENGAFLALLDFIKTPSKELFNFVSYFNDVHLKKMEGELNGNLTVKIDGSAKPSFLFDLSFLNLLLQESYTNKTIGVKKISIKGDSYSKAPKSILPKKFIPLKIKAEIEGGFLSSDNSLLEDVNGSFFYNPELGPNVTIKAMANIKGEKKECSLESRGYFNSKFCNWMDLNFSFSKERDSGIFLKLFEKKKDELLMQMKIDLDNEYFSFLHNILPEKLYSEFNILEGGLSLDGSVQIKDGLKKVVLENFLAKDIKFKVKAYDVSSKEISGSLDFDFADIDSTLSSSLMISGGNVLIGKDEIKDIKASVHLAKGFFEPSFLSCSYNDLKTSAKIDGNISEFVSNIEVKGPTKNILKNSNEQVLSVFSFKRKKEGGYFSGIVQLLGDQSKEENIVFGLNLKNFNFCDFKDSISSMWIRGENFVLEKWQGLFLKDIDLKGKVNFSAFLQNEKFCLQFQAKDFEYKTKDFLVKIEKIGSFEDVFFEKKNFVSFTYEKGLWNVDAPLLNGSYTMNSGLKFDCKNVKLLNHRGSVLFVIPEANSENLNLNGKVFFDFINNKLDIVTKSACGKVSDLSRFVSYFGLSVPAMEGTFESFDGGFYFSNSLKGQKPFDLKMSMAFKDLSYDICDYVHLSNAKMKMDFDAREDTLELENVEGLLKINKKSYNLICPLFSKKNKKLEYDLRIAKPTLDLLRIKGEASFGKNIDFVFDQKSHFLGEKFAASLKLDEKFAPYSFFEMSFDINKACALLDIDIGQKLEGIIKAKATLEKDFLKIEAKAADLLVGDKKIKSLFVNAEKDKEKFSIKELSLNDLKSSFSLEKKEGLLKIKDLLISHKNSFIEAEGTFVNSKVDLNLKNLKLDLEPSADFIKEFYYSDFLKNKLLIQGGGWISLWFKDFFPKIEADLDLKTSKFCYSGVWVENNGELNLCYSNEKGLNVSGLDLIFSSKDLDLSSLKSKFQYLSYDLKEKKWLLKGGYLYLPLSLMDHFQKNSSGSFKQMLYIAQNWLKIEKDLDLELDIEYENENFKSLSKEASIYLNGKKRDLKDLVIKVNKNECILDFKYLHENIYHEASHIFDFASLSGKLILGNESDPLSIFWSCEENNVIINKMLGNYFGLSVDMYLNDKKDRETYSLFGSIKVDFSKALSLMPQDVQTKLKMLQIAKGYEAGGNLSLFKSRPQFNSFEGKVIGKDFELFGLKLKTLFGNVKISPELLEIKGLKISDLAGVFFIPSIDLYKTEDSSWFFSVPKIEAYEIRPSLLKKVNDEESEMKPLVIKNFVVSKLKGKLNDTHSITGEGNFSFINSFKRGHSLFEIPSEVLGRIVGLDSELLVPVCGDVFYDIKDNKCSITKVNNVYSENGRSEFFLIGTPYMDFNGNLNIEIKMKQFVLFKITDKFIISIKGTLGKPELNLKKKKLFSD